MDNPVTDSPVMNNPVTDNPIMRHILTTYDIICQSMDILLKTNDIFTLMDINYPLPPDLDYELTPYVSEDNKDVKNVLIFILFGILAPNEIESAKYKVFRQVMDIFLQPMKQHMTQHNLPLEMPVVKVPIKRMPRSFEEFSFKPEVITNLKVNENMWHIISERMLPIRIGSDLQMRKLSYGLYLVPLVIAGLTDLQSMLMTYKINQHTLVSSCISELLDIMKSHGQVVNKKVMTHIDWYYMETMKQITHWHTQQYTKYVMNSK